MTISAVKVRHRSTNIIRYILAPSRFVPTLVVPQRFPDAGPENVAIVHVHHYPLTVERVLVYWTGLVVNAGCGEDGGREAEWVGG